MVRRGPKPTRPPALVTITGDELRSHRDPPPPCEYDGRAAPLGALAFTVVLAATVTAIVWMLER